MTKRKITPLSALLEKLEEHRKAGQTIVMTNGCFDLLHVGHVSSLEAAKEQGDILVVALNSDVSVKALKGPSRPIVPENERAEMLAALECVDYVVLFDDANVENTVIAICPNVLVKANQYTLEQIPGRNFIEKNGGRVVTVSMRSGISTTSIIERLLSRGE